MSEKSSCNINITETEEGFRIDVTGATCEELLKRMKECCCKDSEKDCC